MSFNSSNTDQYPVYLGVWTNWSRGKVYGLTLTLRRQEANLLVAFTAFFIAFVATRFWRIVCFAFHRVYATNTSQNAVYHQRQAILRNSSSPEEGIRLLLSLAWANKDRRGRLPTLLIAFIALLSTTAFTAAGGLSSQISSAVGTEVLIKSLNCGRLEAKNAPNSTDEPVSETQSFFALVPIKAEGIDNAANYAQQCYSNNTAGNLDCGRFITKRLPSFIDKSAACPFEEKVCRSNSKNLRIDSGYLDSHEHFGLNIRDKFFMRNVLHCAPITTTGYTSQRNTSIGDITLYHYGSLQSPSGPVDYVFAAKSIKSQYEFGMSSEFPVVGANYGVSPMSSKVKNKTIIGGGSWFTPISPLLRDDGDITLVFLSGDGVIHSAPSHDDWYRVSPTSVNVVEGTQEIVESAAVYLPLEPASPLGCVDQYQYCYEDAQHCGVLASNFDARTSAVQLMTAERGANSTSEFSFNYFRNAFSGYQSTTISELLGQLGPTSLASKNSLTSAIQGPVPSDQWQQDVIRWWDITMASIQAAFLGLSYFNPSDPSMLAYRTNFTSPELQKLCNNQKIRSTAYTSFSVLGLIIIAVIGLLIALVSYLLEPISRLLHRKWSYQTFAHLEWNTNATLQLQRLAHEQLGFGTWSKGTAEIPVTEAGDLLGRLDISNLKHPLLYPPDKAYAHPQKTLSVGETSETLTPITSPSDRQVSSEGSADSASPVAERVPQTPSIPQYPSPPAVSETEGIELHSNDRVTTEKVFQAADTPRAIAPNSRRGKSPLPPSNTVYLDDHRTNAYSYTF